MRGSEEHACFSDIKYFKEKLAELCHNQWSGWMEYLFSKSVNPIEPNGTVIIPKWAVDRWKRQMKTKYPDLSEEEKESDRSEAEKFLKILTEETT